MNFKNKGQRLNKYMHDLQYNYLQSILFQADKIQLNRSPNSIKPNHQLNCFLTPPTLMKNLQSETLTHLYQELMQMTHGLKLQISEPKSYKKRRRSLPKKELMSENYYKNLSMNKSLSIDCSRRPEFRNSKTMKRSY